MVLPSHKEIEIPLLQALVEMGGYGKTRDTYSLVTKRFPQLTEKDLAEKLKSGQNRWTNRIQWVHHGLSKKGETLFGDRGIWHITPKGIDRLKAINEMVDAEMDIPRPVTRASKTVRLVREQSNRKKSVDKPPPQSSFTEEIAKIVEVSQRLSTFQAHWMTFEDFEHHVDRMKNYFAMYKEIWITGHFSYNFARKLHGLCKKYPNCDIRILSINPKGNQNNLRALKKLKEDGAKVKIHPALHARIFIGYNEETSLWQTIIGSYDYNREGISGENINASISSKDINVVQQARGFFSNLWNSTEASDKF